MNSLASLVSDVIFTLENDLGLVVGVGVNQGSSLF